jgi:hypothetical protein
MTRHGDEPLSVHGAVRGVTREASFTGCRFRHVVCRSPNGRTSMSLTMHSARDDRGLGGPGERWDARRALAEQLEFEGHVGFVTGLREGGAAIEVGPLRDPAVRSDDDLVGLALLDVDSVEDAERVFAGDPIVQAGVCAIRAYRWVGVQPLRR